jgi:hypothetical protein
MNHVKRLAYTCIRNKLVNILQMNTSNSDKHNIRHSESSMKKFTLNERLTK